MTWSRTAYANSATARREAFVKLAMIHQMTRRGSVSRGILLT
jgi:hypothetical protein